MAVLGAGRMGRTLAHVLTRAGHDVRLGSRTIRAGDAESPETYPTVGYAAAAAGADWIFLATDGRDSADALVASGPHDGRIIVDCTNPERADGYTLDVGRTTSGGEANARIATGAKVVKALNHVWAESLLDPELPSRRPVTFVCGDDDDAKALVSALLESIGLTPVDAGPLRSARHTEPLAALVVNLVTGMGWAPTGVELTLAGGA